MFGKKAKELGLLLSQRNAENEQLKERLKELEAEVAKLKEQEELVVRSLTDANRTAKRIEDEANEQRDRLLADADQQVKDAEEKISSMLAQADEDAANVRKDADDYSENIRTDANIYVERTIIASQMEVKKRKDVMAELNELLKKTTDYLSEQTETFSSMLKSVIEDNEEQTEELCRDIEKCDCSCEECEHPCKAQAARPPKKAKSEDDEDEDEESEEGEAEEPAEEAAEPVAEDEPESQDEAAHMEPDIAAEAAEELPDAAGDPAQVMKNIYYLQRRVIPIENTDRVFSDASPKGGVTFPDELGNEEPEEDESSLPHDRKLGDIVSVVISAS
ncbi:MAG: hypothetical protein J5772_07860 [Clostridia bacterium]|nr:hypothetical protein [Clostridia bacterium]